MELEIDHIQLAIPAGGETASRDFWADIIGLDEITKPAALKPRGGCWFALAGTQLHLGVEEPFTPAKKAHPGFRIMEIKTLAARLERASHPVKWDTTIKTRQRFFCEDPFGNRLEFLKD